MLFDGQRAIGWTDLFSIGRISSPAFKKNVTPGVGGTALGYGIGGGGVHSKDAFVDPLRADKTPFSTSASRKVEVAATGCRGDGEIEIISTLSVGMPDSHGEGLGVGLYEP